MDRRWAVASLYLGQIDSENTSVLKAVFCFFFGVPNRENMGKSSTLTGTCFFLEGCSEGFVGFGMN